MSKIKVIGGIIVLILTVLATVTTSIAHKSGESMALLEQINRQKTFTQEVAKSVLYLYKRGDNSSKILEQTIQKFLNQESRLIDGNRDIAQLWNRFYLKIAKFQQLAEYKTPYSSLTLEKLINEIYTLNIQLIIQFDKLIEEREELYQAQMKFYKYLERGIFALLILLLSYLFTQIHEIIEFIQKFYRTSKTIREKSTIQGATPLEIETREESLRGITRNYNYLLNKIDSSITYADKSIKVTLGAIEEIEQNIEDFMELIATMEDKKSDELFKKEDKVIDSLETLISLKDRLNILRKNLKELI